MFIREATSADAAVIDAMMDALIAFEGMPINIDDTVWTHVFIAECDGGTVGMIALYRRDERSVTLGNLYVLPAYRQRGIGRALLEHAIGFADVSAIEAYVHAENTVSLALFSSLGFSINTYDPTLLRAHRVLPLVGSSAAFKLKTVTPA